MTALETMKTFDLDTLPDLDTAVEAALEMLTLTKLPDLDTGFNRPLVVGSVNAATTGQLLFADGEALFADESEFEIMLSKNTDIDGVVVVSASGSKHSIMIGERLRELGVPGVLLTNNPEAPAASFFDREKVFIFPKNREPYTYNTSTYLSMIVAKTKEDPALILEHLKKLDLSHVNLGQFTGFTFILSPQHAGVAPMLRVKFEELFGIKVCSRFFTPEEMKHAKTVVPDEGELFVYVGMEELSWGEEGKKIELPLPKNSGPAAALATCYHFIGKVQNAHQPYFKDNVVRYCQEADGYFGVTINPIVE